MPSTPNFANLPLRIEVPLPRKLEIGRGINSTRGSQGCLITCKALVSERELLNEAAFIMGITGAMFQRCLINDVGSMIVKLAQSSGTYQGFPPLPDE